MKNLLFASLLCGTLAQVGTGCVIIEDGTLLGVFDVKWTLTAGVEQTPLDGCEQGITANVVSQNVLTGQQYIDMYLCAQRYGQTRPLPAGDYDVWVNVYNDIDLGSELIAQSDIQRASIVSNGDVVPLGFYFPAGGYFEMTWRIDDKSGPDAACADLNADRVLIDTTLIGSNTAISRPFSCDDYYALTPQILLGEYRVYLNLQRGKDSLYLITPGERFALEYGSQIVDLGNFVFDLASLP